MLAKRKIETDVGVDDEKTFRKKEKYMPGKGGREGEKKVSKGKRKECEGEGVRCGESQFE